MNTQQKRPVTSPRLQQRPATRRAPGRAERTGMTLLEMFQLIPDEAAAGAWFEDVRWGEGRFCGHCGSTRTRPVPNQKPMPYWCTACRKYFSIKTGTPMQSSKLPLQKWAMALYLMCTNLKGVSSMKLHRDLGITQKHAWHMMHRIRDAWASYPAACSGPVEVDETYIGGKEKSKHGRKKTKAGRGAVGKTAVVGLKDRATKQVQAAVVARTNQATLHEFVQARTDPDATVYTDDHGGYRGLQHHEVVKHSVGEYVKDQAHTNGIESFWSMLKRGYTGTYHKMSVKHLPRYVTEFAGRHNVRTLDTIDQMRHVARGMVGKRLRYQDVIR